MDETLPQQIEPQTWQRELPLHREGASVLKPEETLALIGSFTQSSLEGYKQDNETGELSDQSFSIKQRIHTEALQQLATLRVDDSTNALNAIEDRRMELETILKTPHGGTRSTAETLEIRIQLDGVKLLDEMYTRVQDTIDLYAQTQSERGNKFTQRNRAAAINEVITLHNEQVSSASENIADSPAAQEAQARINAHYAEQARQQQPTETIDDARHKVAEAIGGMGENEQQALIGEVAQAAKGVTRIYTDIPRGLMLKSSSGDFKPYSGFNSFGDGLEQESRFRNEKLIYGGSAEAFLIEPDTTTQYKTVTKSVEIGGSFRKKTEQTEEQVPDGEVPTMVVNPVTGQQEPGIKVAYQFNGNQRSENGQTVWYDGPDYITESRRAGNMLFVETTLPKSVADKLRQSVTDNPELAREFAKTLALNNGITEQAWNNGVRPPYDEIPKDWELTIADLQKETTQLGEVRHNVVTRKAMKVGR